MANLTLAAMTPQRKTGDEPFREGARRLGFELRDFWQWACSDLVSNSLRGKLAEYLVARALGIAGGLRAEWDAFDLVAPNGCKVEVKSAAYVQTWAQKSPSKICFCIGPTRYWDTATNVMEKEIRRQADVYVFALLSHPDKSSIDPLDVAQWEFFLIRASILNDKLRTQKSISLTKLRSLDPVLCQFQNLRAQVESLFQVGAPAGKSVPDPGLIQVQ